MSFFILTGAILLGTIVIVHFAANALGFRLFYTSLFLSAALALAVNLIVISMKEVTSPLSIAKIFLIVLVFSALVTVINDVLTRYEIKKLQKRREKRKEEAAEEFAEVEANADEYDVDEDDAVDDLESDDGEETAPRKDGFLKRLFNKVSAFSFKKKSAGSSENAADDETLETVRELPEEASIKEDVDVKIDEKEAAKAEPMENTESDGETEEKEKPIQREGFFNKLFKKNEPPREKVDVSKFTDLDAILDFAYDAKISGKYLDAVDAYEGAIERYENDPYLPFLFIDLGNVHKAQGEYNAAIDVYEKAINMPNIQKDLNILRSFEENIDYLKALKIVLRKHKAEHKPFGDIDEAILKEVESSLDK